MPQVTYHHELHVAATLARAAGKAALAHYKSGVAVTYKEGGCGPVTAADQEANALIVEGLAEHFPDDAILAEESPSSHAPSGRRTRRRLWCVDPIDGTREFIEQTGQFAVMLGLAIDGTARLGVVYEPVTDTLWQGVIGEDGRRGAAEVHRAGTVRSLSVSRQDHPPEARMMVSPRGPGRAAHHVGEILGVHRTQALGSVGLKVAWLASGQAELYVCATDKVHEWDTCGPEAILRAAGGEVTDLFGERLRYNKEDTHVVRGMLASNGALHPALVAAVATALPEAPGLQRMKALTP